MIRLNNLNKHYNRGKLNEIHVINNTSIEFPEKGLVALTGPSGCGKTTILNVLGGLDSFESGSIDFFGEVIATYNPSRWDILRNKYIGYIFQNYNLVIDKTVFENVEIALNMAGLYEKAAVEERVHYVLKSVGMYNYRKRSVLALSGGQQQRVAIARAIAKNPRVILADEPTGNLDANNTFEIMSLIKKISKTCLVILVSHERELVDFYADRVIELMDGKIINDIQNEGNRTLERIDDRNIYLRDLEKEVITGNVDVDYYYQDKPKSIPLVKLIHYNNTLFVKVEGAQRIKYLTNEAEIRLIDDNYRKPETEDAEKRLFDLDQFPAIAETGNRKSFIRFKDTILAGFSKVINGKKIFSKLFLVVYFVISALVVFNLATLGNLTKITEQDFVQMPRNLVSVPIDETLTAGKVQQILGLESIVDYSTYRSSRMLTVRFEDLYQGSGYRSARGDAQVFPVTLSNLDNPQVLVGRLPANETEFAIDAWVADRFLENKSVLDLGIIGYEEMIGGVTENYEIKYSAMTLVGIVETNAPVIVLTDANEFYFNRPLIQGGSLGSAAGQFTLTLGSQMLQNGEILLPSFMSQLLGANFTYAGKTFTVVGKYEDSELSFIVTNDDYRDIMLSELLATTEAQASLLFFTTANDAAISELGSIDVTAEDMITVARTEYLEQQREEIGGRLQTIVISLGGAVVFIFFAMRSSMLGRIKEIGVYRSIGATKADIYKIFISEILAFTTIGSLSGYLFMTYIVNEVERMFDGVITVFHFPVTIFILGISGIYLVNLIFGMIPIYSLLRKTPSEINAKFDI